VATDHLSFAALLREVVACDGRLWFFGEGLCLGAPDPEQMWNRLVDGLTATEVNARKPQALRGFLHQLRVDDALLATALLDSAVEHEIPGKWYPFLQAAVELDAADVARLKLSVARGRAPATMYQYLAFGRTTDPIPHSIWGNCYSRSPRCRPGTTSLSRFST
jgi:hypothetical protein